MTQHSIARLNGGQALIQSLQREGIHIVFGVPGQGQYEAVDALYSAPGIRYISLRHEQAATYMADAYYRVRGEMAAALVVSGPGYFNAMAGMATANAVSSTMLLVTGTRHQRTITHSTLPGQEAVTTWAGRAARPADIPTLVRQARQHACTGRPAPVALEIPAAVFAATEDVELWTEDVALKPSITLRPIQDAAQALVTAHRPLLWAGAGVIRAGASEPLRQLAEHLQIPVVTTRQGKGAISDRHPLCLGYAELRYAPLRQWVEASDLILAVGASADFSGYSQRVIEINIDGDKSARAAVEQYLVGDARALLEALYEEVVERREAVQNQVSREVATLRTTRFDPQQQLQPQWGLMQAIRRAIPDDGILVPGMNQMGYYSRNYYPVYTPGAYLTASQLATLGCAYPLALGAKLARPERAVVCLSGDGGFLYNVQEVATAAHYQIGAVAIVFNDNAYGNVLRAQIEQFDGRVIGTRLHNPDFVQLARAFGVRGERAENASQLEVTLREALAANKPTVIEVPVGMMEREY